MVLVVNNQSRLSDMGYLCIIRHAPGCFFIGIGSALEQTDIEIKMKKIYKETQMKNQVVRHSALATVFTLALLSLIPFSTVVLIGKFDLLTLATLGSGLDWQLDYLFDEMGTTDIVRLSVVSASTVPVPSAVWLFTSGLLGLISVAKRKMNSHH